MPAIGITGGISTGKSSFSKFLRQILPEANFFDADAMARELVENDPRVKEELRREFGDEVFSSTGDLKRDAIRVIILEDAAKKRALEKILHPPIRRQWSAQAKEHRQSSDFFFADIPLLYETGGEPLCDRVVVVACSRQIQSDRLLQRGIGSQNAPAQRLQPNLRSEAEAMIDSQMPLADKIKRADYVVWNNDGLPLLEKQSADLAALWKTTDFFKTVR